MKKYLLLLSATFAATAAATAAVGDTFTEGLLNYEVIADGQVAVTGYDKTATEIVIPETVSYDNASYTVTTVGNSAFYWASITSVTLPNSVVAIEDYGFYNCKNLTTVAFGTGLKTIGSWAFGYTAVTPLTLPEGLESLGGSCFYRADNLTSLTLPTTLKTIGTSCFYKCPFTSIQLPESLEDLGAKAFLYCESLAEVNLPSGLKEIKDGTFYGTSLTTIALPEGLTSIGEEAFYEVPLTELTLPASLESIGGSAFTKTNLTRYNLAAGSTNFTIVDDVLYTGDKTLLVSFPAKCATTELTLPTECIGISSGAFDETGIQKVTVGNKFRAFDEYAFCKSKLAEINFPESCVYIGEQAFAGTRLTNVVLPKNLPMLQEAAFASSEYLASVTIPAKMTYIGLRAFYGCTSLATVNCQGMTPPRLEDWYEGYESPFYNIPEAAVCNIPVGAMSAYSGDSNWNSVFGGNFVESLAAAIVPTAADPSDGSDVASFEGVTLTFGESVSVANSNPAITVVEGSLVAGVPIGNAVSVDMWLAVTNSSTEIRIFPADYDSFTCPFNMEEGKEYFVTIPAGTVKNAAGDVNEEITLQYNGTYVRPTVQLTGVNPEADSELTEIGTLTFTFAESVGIVTSKLSDVRVVKGSPDGETVSNGSWMTVSGKSSGTEVAFFASDEYGEGYAEPIALAPGVDYYVVVPAGLFRLTSSYSTLSEEIVLHYVGENEAVELVAVSPADGSTDVAEIGTLTFTFAESVSIVTSKLSDVRVVKGSPDGETVSNGSWMTVSGKSSGTEVAFFASDEYGEGYAEPIALALGLDYYVVVPAGLFRLTSSSSTLSEEIVLHYSNGSSGITEIEVDVASGNTEIFTVDGRRVASMQAGRVYIVRQGSKTCKVLGR